MNYCPIQLKLAQNCRVLRHGQIGRCIYDKSTFEAQNLLKGNKLIQNMSMLGYCRIVVKIYDQTTNNLLESFCVSAFAAISDSVIN